jgi:hypothetical protein
MSLAEASDVFVRRIDTPPGAPWDQARAARLEALHGGPLGASDLAFSVKRLSSWAPGAPGEFAAAYMHRARVSDQPVMVRVGAVEHAFRFRDAALERRRLAELTLTLGMVAAATLALGLAGERALSVRAANEAQLAQQERLAARQRQLAAEASSRAADAGLLLRAGVPPAGVAGLADDLLWLGQAKAPSVVVQRVRWTPQAMEVLSEGPGEPVLGAERRIEPAGDFAGARLWRITRPSMGPTASGVSRPSVVTSAPQRPSVR